MTTITFEIPDEKAVKYKEILTSFVVEYNLADLEQMKNEYNFSKKLYLDYKNDFDGSQNSFSLNTSGKKDTDILSELDKNLWN